MNDIRYKNLYDALTSQIDYCNFIETYGEDNVTFENTNFDLLQTIYGGFSLTQLMDDYFIKQNGITRSILMPEYIRQLVEMIAKNNGNGYTVGDLSYHDEYTVLEKFRNKLAHGDFIIQNGEIIFEENKVEGRINVEKFLGFIFTFETEPQKYTLNTPFTKIFNKMENISSLNVITSEDDIDIVCNNLYRVEIKDCPMIPKNRDAYYFERRESFYQLLKEKIMESSLEELEEFIKKQETRLKKYGIYMTHNITKLKNLDYYEKLKEKYMEMNSIHKRLPLVVQINRINNMSYIMGKGQYQKFDIRKGIQLNRVILEELKKHPNYSLVQLSEQKPSIMPIYMYHIDSAILSSYLMGFNAAYEYGLEKGLTQKGNYNLVSIFEGKSLDFSKLELDKLDDPNMLIEHTFTKYLTDVTEYELKTITEVDRTIEIAKKKLEQYTRNCKKQTEEKVLQFKEEIKEVEMLKSELLMDIVALKEFSNEFDLDKYTRNINIITHIRNAIAHGNVFVDSYETDIENTQIIFKDYLDGQLVYEKQIQIRDFVLLFHSTNIQCVYDFIINNISDKTLIDEDYYENIVVRSLLRETREIRKNVQLKKTIL